MPETPSPDDELLLILLRNLRNAAATFGEGTPSYEGIRTVVEEHLQAMREQGLSTNLAEARRVQVKDARSSAGEPRAATLANLAFRPKPSS